VSRDRDKYVEKHRRGVPSFVAEEGTGRHEGEELQRIRSNRPTPVRFKKVEERQDKFELKLVELGSKVDTLLDYAAKADAERIRRAEMDAVALERKRKHTIAIITTLGVAIAAIVAAGVV